MTLVRLVTSFKNPLGSPRGVRQPPDVHIVVTNAYTGFDQCAALVLELYLATA